MHPLLRLLTTQPQLLADHAQAYGELAGAELSRVSTAWKRRAVLGAVGAVCLGVTTVLAGVALLLWAAIPVAQMPAPWLLVVVPLVTAAAALGCILALRAGDEPGAFEEIRQQIQADIAMLREATAP